MARESSLARYGRLINLIPMLYANPSLEIAEVARDLGITEKQLLDDLNLLWMCGLPGHSHLELIDMNFESGFIEIIEPQNLARPLNLTPLEVTEILLGLELISAAVDPSTLVLLDSVRTKLAEALPSSPRVSDAIRVEREEPSTDVAGIRSLLLQAIAEEKEIVATYRSLSGRELKERRLIPLQIVTRDGHDYLSAVEHGENVRKVFRLDRFDHAQLGEESESITPLLILTEPLPRTLRIEVPEERAFLADRVNAIQVGSSQDRVILEFRYFEAQFAARVALAFGAGTQLIGSGPETSEVAELLERLLGQVRDAYAQRQ